MIVSPIRDFVNLAEANLKKEERIKTMAFSFKNSKGNTYYLHATTRKLKSGKEQQLYFFSKTPKMGVLDKIPAGYEVGESKSGLPFLKKK